MRLAEVAPRVKQEIRYATANNFTGAPVSGYDAAACWLRREAAEALAAAERDAEAAGFQLVVYDCYRPKRAVAAFVEWSKTGDERMKAEFFPRVAKRELFKEGYIALISSHSTGLAVDIGVVGWDFGTPFDRFDPASFTSAATIPTAAANHARLVALMRAHGFQNYAREWWHYNFVVPGPTPSYDAPIVAPAPP